MADYAEEQAMEIEALESIFMDELKVVPDGGPGSWKPSGSVYKLEIWPQREDGEPTSRDDQELGVEMMFAHTPNYPEERPLVKVSSIRGLSKQEVEGLQSSMQEEIEASIGMSMIYTLITVAQEWVNDMASTKAGPTHDPEAERRRLEELEEARRAELRAHGTVVTPETFAKWKHDFDEEMKASNVAAVSGDKKAQKGTNTLTGKQWFLLQEAQHIDFEEPDLDIDEEIVDVAEVDEEEDGDSIFDDDSDDDDVLNSLLEQQKQTEGVAG